MMNRQSRRHSLKRYWRRYWPRKPFVWGGLALLLIVLAQLEAVAQPTPEAGTQADSIEAFKVLQLVCVSIGIFAGSLLAVESRRWRTFFVGLVGIVAIASAIAATGFAEEQFPDTKFLVRPAITGLVLGVVLVGSWWWGNRQGYTHALYVIAFRPNKEDSVFDWLFENWLSQHEITEIDMPIRQPNLLESLYFRAAAVRYRRLMRRPEIEGLYRLIVDDVLRDAEEARAQQRREDKERKLMALIDDVESQYVFTQPVPSVPPIPTAAVSTHE